jgi:D-alanyl-D-alanine carboxypeptidase
MKHIGLITMLCLLHQVSTSQEFDSAWGSKFQSLLVKNYTKYSIKGAAAAVYTPWAGSWSGSCGVAVPGVPCTTDRAFCIGSNTKLFIAVTMFKLQEQGLLNLDDSLYKWLPVYKNVDSTVTIRQLLTHRSGIFDFLNDDNGVLYTKIWTDTGRTWSPLAILGGIGSPWFKPGQGFRYSNTNYLLAGMIIDAATGSHWYTKIRELILDPLGLDNTFTAYYEPVRGKIASNYYYACWYKVPPKAPYSAAGAAGGMYSTVQDMVKWYHALFNGEVLSPESMKEFLSIEPATLYGYGIVAGLDPEEKVPELWHDGSFGMYISIVGFDEQTKSAICILTSISLDDPQIGALYCQFLNLLHHEYPRKENDAGVEKILQPRDHICNTQVTPTIVLRNNGSSDLTSATIVTEVDRIQQQQYSWTGIIGSGDSMIIQLDELYITPGNHTLQCYSIEPNGMEDGYAFNDSAKVEIACSGTEYKSLPWKEGFEGSAFPPPDWVLNPTYLPQWGRTTTACQEGVACLVKGNFWDGNDGNKYRIYSPLIRLDDNLEDTFSFWYAYRYYPKYLGDSLQIQISDDCGISWVTLFYSGGESLATTSPYSRFFYPFPDNWKKVAIPLTGYSGNVIFRFTAVCGMSNTLYIDNILLDHSATKVVDIPVGQTVSAFPNPFTLGTSIRYSVKVQGRVVISAYDQTGREVYKLMDSFLSPGEYQLDWKAEELPAGIYLVKLVLGNEMRSVKLIKQ